MNNKFIELIDVHKIKKQRTILDHIHLTLEQGKIYGFKGINGSGKTMLFRAILGLIRCGGQINIAGNELKMEKAYPVEAGLLIEAPALVNEFTAIQNMKLLASLKKQTVSDEEIIAMIKLVGLAENDKRRASQYSLGMRKKLGLALAFIGEKDLLVLDEPTNALDEASIARVKDILFDYKKRGTTILFISHDANFLAETADQILRVEDGRVYHENEI